MRFSCLFRLIGDPAQVKMIDTTYDGLVSPVNSTQTRDFIVVMYQQGIITSANLREWMLSRKGSYRLAYIPFYRTFVMLYESTKNLSVLSKYHAEKKLIEAWISQNTYLKQMSARKQLTLANDGINLFSRWSEILFQQNIIEFR